MRGALLLLACFLALACDRDPNANLDALNDADPFGCEFDEDCESSSCDRATGRCNSL